MLFRSERNAYGGQQIHWQRCYGDLDVASSYGEAGDGEEGTDFPGMGPDGAEVTAAAGTEVMFVEVYYDYQPMLYGKVVGQRRMHSNAALHIRGARDLTQVYNPSYNGRAYCTGRVGSEV